jgi:hypothetical protein
MAQILEEMRRLENTGEAGEDFLSTLWLLIQTVADMKADCDAG